MLVTKELIAVPNVAPSNKPEINRGVGAVTMSVENEMIVFSKPKFATPQINARIIKPSIFP